MRDSTLDQEFLSLISYRNIQILNCAHFGLFFDLQFLFQNSSNWSLLCSYSISNNGVPLLCLLFLSHQNILKELSQFLKIFITGRSVYTHLLHPLLLHKDICIYGSVWNCVIFFFPQDSSVQQFISVFLSMNIRQLNIAIVFLASPVK